MKNNIIISTIVGTIVAFLMMYIAWKHNPQCEIDEKGVINFEYLLSIGISWLFLAFVVVFIFLTILNEIIDKK